MTANPQYPVLTLKYLLNDILKNCDRALEMPPSQGGSGIAQTVASALFCKASGHLSYIEEAEANLAPLRENAERFTGVLSQSYLSYIEEAEANLAIAKENAERFLGTDEAKAAISGEALSTANAALSLADRDILKDIRAVKTIEKKRLPAETKVFETLDAAEFFADVLNEGDEDGWAYEVIGVTDHQRNLTTNIVAYAIEVSDEDEEFVAYWTEI